MTDEQFDLAIIGGGPAGYVAAIRASQIGFRVVCVEKRAALGGTCLNVGCVPSKALLESSAWFAKLQGDIADHGIRVENVALDLALMMSRKEEIVKNITKGVAFLFKKNNVMHVQGEASIISPQRIAVAGPNAKEISCKRILIAAGASPKSLPGVDWDGDIIGDSTAALSYSEVPDHLVVIGAGAVGLELGSVWKRLGAKVTVLEFMDAILPGTDSDIAKQALKYLKRQKLEIRTGVRVQSALRDGALVRIKIEGSETLFADRVLVATGRTPNTRGLNLDSLGVTTDSRGVICVNEKYETSVPGIYAAGDVIGGILLAHKASEEAVSCVEGMAGMREGRVDPALIPSVVYTEPEIASVGQTEDYLKREKVEYMKGEFLFRANARAQGLGEIDGTVKVLADKKTEKLLGVHIIGPYAGELIAEAVLAVHCGLSVRDIAHTCHAHPTLSECLKEAALSALSQAIHA